MQANKSASNNLIAGILFGIMALLSLVGLVQYFSIWNLLSLAALAYTAAMLLISRKDVLLCGGFGVMALVDFISLVTPYSNKFSLLLEFLGFAAMVVLLVALTTNAMPSFRQTAKKLWFVPAACLAVCSLVSLIQALQILTYGYGLHLSAFFGEVLVTVGCVFAGMWIASLEQSNPAASQYAAGTAAGSAYSAYSGASGTYNTAGSTYSYQAASAPVTPADAMYCGLAKHVLLLLFTFGIWYFIWIYRVTGYLNQVEDEPPRNPTTKLLLCMFVPFYLIYWVYKSAQRIDKLSAAKGMPSDLSTLCLILAIFVGIIPPILMQDKINAIITADGYAAPTGATYSTPQQPQQPQQAAPQPQAAPRRAGAYIDVPGELKKYKELLDMGAITQEEFDAKKQQLLNL